MEFEFYCPCGKLLTAEKEWIGKRAQCPACSNVLRVPKPNRVAEVVGPTQQQIRETAEAQAQRKRRTEEQPVEAQQDDVDGKDQENEPIENDLPVDNPAETRSGDANVVVGRLRTAGVEGRGDLRAPKGLVAAVVVLLLAGAFLLGRMTQTPQPVGAARAPTDSQVAVATVWDTARDHVGDFANVADVTAPPGKIEEPEKPQPDAGVAAQIPTLFGVTVTGASETHIGLAGEQAKMDDPDVTGGKVGEQHWELVDEKSNAQIAMAAGLSEPAGVADVTDVGTVAVQRTADREAMARILIEWDESVRLETLIECHERNVYLAGTGEGVSLFLDPARASVPVTLADETTGSEVLEAVAANGNDLLSLLKVCREFSAERAIGDKLAGEMLHMVVFGVRQETADSETGKMVTFAPGLTTDLLALAKQFGPPTARQWWAGDNMQRLRMSGLVFWWGHVGVAAGDDGQITHVLLRGPWG